MTIPSDPLCPDTPRALTDPDYECAVHESCSGDTSDCEIQPKWWTCRYYQTAGRTDIPTETCSFGCWEEPNCVTGQPSEGWPE